MTINRFIVLFSNISSEYAKDYCPKQDNYILILLTFLHEIASSLMLPPEQRRASLAMTPLLRHCLIQSLRAKRGNLVFEQV
jgi:hypothetical protein